MYRVIIYKNPYTPKPISERVKKTMSKMSFSSIEQSREFSIRRTRRTIHDLVRCNEFDLFVTFTFDPAKVDRYDIGAVYVKMQSWLWRQHRKNENFKYLIVPERHKDGAIHFHALMSDYPFLLKKSRVIQDSRRVHNITNFRFGFTNATFVPEEEKDKVGNYIAKYITKDMVVLHNKRRYWSSRNLRKPITYYNEMYNMGLNRHVDHKTMVSESDFNVGYEIPKDLLDK